MTLIKGDKVVLLRTSQFSKQADEGVVGTVLSEMGDEWYVVQWPNGKTYGYKLNSDIVQIHKNMTITIMRKEKKGVCDD